MTCSHDRRTRPTLGWLSGFMFIMAGMAACNGAWALTYFADLTGTAVFYLAFLVCGGLASSLRYRGL